MSDFAFVDVENPVVVPIAKTATVLGAFRAHDFAAEATVASLVAVLEGVCRPTVVSSEPNVTSLVYGYETVHTPSRRACSRILAGTDAIIVVNPIFGEGRGLLRLADVAVRARLSGRPLAVIGATASSLETRLSRCLARSIVHNADLFLVRDELSADLLASVGIEPPFRMGADPAWTQLDDLFAAKDPLDQVVVAIEGESGDERLRRTLIEALRPLAALGLKVMLQPWKSSPKALAEKSHMAHDIAASIGADVIQTPVSLREAREGFSESRVVLALGSTTLMTAACAGARTVALAHDPGIEQFSKALDVPFLRHSAPPHEVTAAVLAAAGRTATTSPAVRQYIDRAKGTVELVRLLITEGAGGLSSVIDPLPLYPNPWRS